MIASFLVCSILIIMLIYAIGILVTFVHSSLTWQWRSVHQSTLSAVLECNILALLKGLVWPILFVLYLKNKLT